MYKSIKECKNEGIRSKEFMKGFDAGIDFACKHIIMSAKMHRKWSRDVNKMYIKMFLEKKDIPNLRDEL